MAQSVNLSKKKVKISTRISIPIMLVVVFQILTYFVILVFGGEFRNIRDYAYSTLAEKTENRSAYIQSELRGKPILVQEFSEQIDSMVTAILEEENAAIADLQTDKELSQKIIESSTDIILALLRRSAANGAFIILETGSLYEAEVGSNARPALYLRDLDPTSGAGVSDILLEVGPEAISQEYGISRDFGWTAFFAPAPDDTENAAFYYRTIRRASENSRLASNLLGYWSSFSTTSPMLAPSMKYTLPLISQDGTVYGVLGIGLMESTILANMPSNDFLSETACYVLGHSTSDSVYDVVTYSGSAYGSLLGDADTLYVGDKLEKEKNIYDFDMETATKLLGSVQQLGLYDKNSVYADEQWALVSVADRSSVLRPVTFLFQMLMVSALVSLLVAAIVAVLSCTRLIRPIEAAIRQMKAERKFNEVIHFEPSNIYEIDEMTDAITQLQIDVQSVSSGVSKMISAADVGLGTFMYDRTDDSVFVGQSLITVLKLELPQGQDIIMSRREFLDSFRNPEIRGPIAAGLDIARSETQEDYSKVYRGNRLKGGTFWMRLGYTYSHNTAIGVVQDITDTMVEKQRIEHERDYDNLTGLLNRHAYYRHVEQLFHNRDELNVTAFVMVDLDNLKYVNDTFGHIYGDDYIKTAAATLKKFQEYDGIVSRLSGDEFSICLSGFSSKDEVREIITRIHAELMQGSCRLGDGTRFNISGSMGVSWYPDDAESRELLMKYADFAMYTVKHSTKGGIAEFDINSYESDSANLTDVEEISRIIEEGGVKYAFQSIVSAKTGEIYGYEALMRIQSDIFKSPPELLETAKTDAKLDKIERLTWTRSLADFGALIASGQIRETAHIFINSIADIGLEAEDKELLEKDYPQLLSRIVLEILEDESSNEYCSERKVQLMQKWGGQLAIDHFGTGYDSEYAMNSLLPSIIKIDRSIIGGCDKDTARRGTIEKLVKLARNKEILVLAEGVETEGEMKTAIACGVDLLQGYYFARPLFKPQPLDPEIVQMIQELAADA